MIHSVAEKMGLVVAGMGRAQAVLEAALARIDEIDEIKPETGAEAMLIQEIRQLGKLMESVSLLMEEPDAQIKAVVGTVEQLAEEASQHV